MLSNFQLISFLFLSLITLPIVFANTPLSVKCTLTNALSKDPFPSLVKCYKYNNDACCTSVHDDYINQYISEILTDSCLRRYTDFESWMCWGCHPLESTYISVENKEIYLCDTFAQKLWGVDDANGLNSQTTLFDNCGFKYSEKFSAVSGGKNYVIPSEAFRNINEFFQIVKVPFYEDYTIKIIEQKEGVSCYSSANIIKINLIVILFCISLLFI